MSRDVLLRLRQCTDEVDRLSATLPHESEAFVFAVQTVQQLQILQDTVAAGDAREIVFVCSEQIVSLGHSRDAFERLDAGMVDRILDVVTALQKEAHASIEISPPQHPRPGKLIHG